MRGSFVADGNILPCRFVKFSTTTGETGRVAQAGAGESPCGVSQQGTRNAPFTGLDDGYAAIAGENVRVYTGSDPGEEVLIEVDGAYKQGQRLMPSTDGIATATTADHDIYGAIQMQESTAANQLVRCKVVHASDVSMT